MVQGKRTVTDEEILDRFKNVKDPVLSAVELESIWNMSHEGIRLRLNDLVDDGKLETKKPGSSTRVYWLSAETDSA